VVRGLLSAEDIVASEDCDKWDPLCVNDWGKICRNAVAWELPGGVEVLSPLPLTLLDREVFGYEVSVFIGEFAVR
jgi:hypothetical protein